ncbi:MAG: hypothetical protein QOG00_2670, partial [Pyrinomonadaceae bacterium]|nr:hypothetical protein [Pyrinomonadaceae bacterium]
DEGAGDGDALALAAGEFVRAVRHAVAEFDGARTQTYPLRITSQ